MGADQLGSGDMEDELDHATQACADSTACAKVAPEAAAAAAEAAAAAKGTRAQPALVSAASAPASGCEPSPAARCSPTSSTHSEQCGVNNSAGHADALNPALACCQVRPAAHVQASQLAHSCWSSHIGQPASAAYPHHMVA
jgi:hypothetical protein